MRMIIRLRPVAAALSVPVHYNHLVQGLIYHHIDPDLAEYLHDQGLSLEGRSFKLFVFSRLFGRFERHGERLVFRDHLELQVASPIERFIGSLGGRLLHAATVVLGEAEAAVESVSLTEEMDVPDCLVVAALSPITVYSTLYTPAGGKKTYYYSPFENEFAAQIAGNLRKKYWALFGQEPPADWDLSVEPVGISSRHQALAFYKGTVVKGWMGNYRLRGTPALIRLALDAGMGSKNSQGFGMVQPARQGGQGNA